MLASVGFLLSQSDTEVEVLFQKAVNFTEEGMTPKQKIRNCTYAGWYYEKMEMYSRAVEMYRRAKVIAQELGSRSEIADHRLIILWLNHRQQRGKLI